MWKFCMGIIVILSAVGCEDVEDTPTPSKEKIKVDFADLTSFNESDAKVMVTVLLSKTSSKVGTIEIKLNADIDYEFTTDPLADDAGLIQLDIQANTDSVAFIIYPTDNAEIDTDRFINFSLSDVSEGFEIGSKNSLQLEVLDDESDQTPIEFLNKPKSFESISSSDRYKETYTYDQLGKIHKVLWESETPGYKSGVKTYYYASNGLLERINKGTGFDQYYYQENNKIVRAEVVEFGVVKSYTLYDYDSEGNLGGKADYYRQSDGTYSLTMINVYLSDNDHNLYKQLMYVPNGDDLTLISSRTYEHYIPNSENMFPVEIIPSVSMQSNLPGSYRQEENDIDMRFTFSYEVDNNGRVISRTTVSNFGNQVTSYTYY